MHKISSEVVVKNHSDEVYLTVEYVGYQYWENPECHMPDFESYEDYEIEDLYKRGPIGEDASGTKTIDGGEFRVKHSILYDSYKPALGEIRIKVDPSIHPDRVVQLLLNMALCIAKNPKPITDAYTKELVTKEKSRLKKMIKTLGISEEEFA